MRKSAYLLLVLWLAPLAIQAQNKLFTLQEAVQSGPFAPADLSYTQWKPSTAAVTWWSPRSGELNLRTVKGNTAEVVLTLKEINAAIRSYNSTSGNRTNVSPVPELDYVPTDYTWVTDSLMHFWSGNHLVVFNAVSKKVLAQFISRDGSAPPMLSPTGNGLAFTAENNVMIYTDQYQLKEVTTDGTKEGIVNGSDYVHRQEFGIDNGLFWSPQGSYLAFYHKDERMVADYPLVNTADRIAGLNNIKYPMAGMTSEQVTLGVYSLQTGKVSYIETGEPKDQYLTMITWDPSEKYIYIGILNRGQNHLKLNQYDVATGKLVKTLLEEKHPQWVEPEHPLLFLKNKPDHFIYQSERDGYNHLYLYKTDGSLVRQITSGPWVVTEVIGLDEKEENIFFHATEASPTEVQVYSANLKTGKLTRHTKESGTHHAQLNKAGTWLLDKYSSLTMPNEVALIDVRSGKRIVLLTATDPFTAYAMPKAELVKITAADGKTELQGRIIRPHDFDPNKKYPVVVYVYGGPHAQLVHNQWLGGARLWEYYMAQKGYILFTVDNRGSANRGLAFESVIHRHLGQNEMADQMKGIDYLKSLPYVDAKRIGVHGWSYGGFMTISLMLNHSDVFKVAAAGGPVCDWKWYEVMYGERYMDTPQENSDGYDQTSVINKAANLNGKLLVIHGAQDDVVVMQHSMEFIKACIKAGRQVDYFLYPDHKHNVYGKDRIHLMQKITEYFDENL